MEIKHKTVLLQETIDSLEPFTEGTYIDATLGGAGHSRELLTRLQSGKLIVFDVNDTACQMFADDLITRHSFKKITDTSYQKEQQTVQIVNANFVQIAQYAQSNVAGIIADLGFATDQLDWVAGLSFLKDEELDMRMSKDLKIKALDLLNGLYLNELEKLFIKYGDVGFAKKLAKAICTARITAPIKRTLQLNTLIRQIVPFNLRKGDNKHPEAKVYQALRIAVNDELNSLQQFLKLGFDLLRSGGKFAVISFHSGEDRLVKDFFREQVENSKAQYIHKLLKPSEHEVFINNNSRSAKLRVIQKI
jgi:16S rRNA (cytosine1402-N4)-methyltransferase